MKTYKQYVRKALGITWVDDVVNFLPPMRDIGTRLHLMLILVTVICAVALFTMPVTIWVMVGPGMLFILCLSSSLIHLSVEKRQSSVRIKMAAYEELLRQIRNLNLDSTSEVDWRLTISYLLHFTLVGMAHSVRISQSENASHTTTSQLRSRVLSLHQALTLAKWARWELPEYYR